MNQQMKDELRDAWRQREGATPTSGARSSPAPVRGSRAAPTSRGSTRAASRSPTAGASWRCIEGIRELPTPRRKRVFKPVIAAVNGASAGVSLDSVTESDIPIASDKAYFVDPHVSIGLVSSHEMVNMARRVPVAVALRMALLGSRKNA